VSGPCNSSTPWKSTTVEMYEKTHVCQRLLQLFRLRTRMLPAFLKTHGWFWRAALSFAALSAAAFTSWKVTSVRNRKQKRMRIPRKSSRTPCSASRAVHTCVISSSLSSSSSFSTSRAGHQDDRWVMRAANVVGGVADDRVVGGDRDWKTLVESVIIV
jgi:hypothetical protein